MGGDAGCGAFTWSLQTAVLLAAAIFFLAFGGSALASGRLAPIVRVADRVRMVLPMAQREPAVAGLSENIRVVDPAEDHIAGCAVRAFNMAALSAEIGIITFSYRDGAGYQQLLTDDLTDSGPNRKSGLSTDAEFNGRNGAWSSSEIADLNPPWTSKISRLRSIVSLLHFFAVNRNAIKTTADDVGAQLRAGRQVGGLFERPCEPRPNRGSDENESAARFIGSESPASDIESEAYKRAVNNVSAAVKCIIGFIIFVCAITLMKRF